MIETARMPNPTALAWIASVLIEGIPLLILAILLVLWRKPNEDDAANGNVLDLDGHSAARPSLTAAE